MEGKVKLYCLILSIVYLAIIAQNVYTGVQSFMSGLELGMQSAKEDLNFDIFHFKAQPASGLYSYPDSDVNLFSGNNIKSESLEFNVMTFNSHESYPLGIKIFQIVRSIFTFLYMGLLIYIPFLFFGIIKNATRKGILEHKTIKKINRMGLIVVSIFLFNLIFFNIGETLIARELISLQNYRIVFDWSDLPFLILGIVILLMGEILKISLKMKEEQDLTI